MAEIRLTKCDGCGRQERGPFSHARVDVAHETCFRAVLAHVDDRGALLDHVRIDEAGDPGRDDEDVRVERLPREVVRV